MLGINDRYEFQFLASRRGGGGCHTRHGERIYFLGPWVCAEALPGGLITHCEPGARGAVRGALATPTTLRQLCNPSWGCGMSL